MTENTKPVEILLMEDNEGDVFLTKKAFESARIINNITVAPDGEAGMDILRRKGKYAEFPNPDIILLDINMPKKDGKQVLEEIKNDPRLRRIPVVILTSSHADQDILKTYDLHANSYIIKPGSLEKFYGLVTAIENFWFNAVALPPHPKQNDNEV